jgi:hypothetical protein
MVTMRSQDKGRMYFVFGSTTFGRAIYHIRRFLYPLWRMYAKDMVWRLLLLFPRVMTR